MGMTVATVGDGTSPTGTPLETGSAASARRRGAPGIQPNPRQALVEALATAVARGASVGDLELARLAHDALGRLLETQPGGDGNNTVFDLDSF
jgi:hypothetical protein